jgi:Tetracyclin repressor-like, C-terminal domain
MFLDAGLTAPESVKALNALASYILGSVTLQLGVTISGPPDEAHARAQQDMARLAEAAGFPHLRECLPHFAGSDVDDQFEFGLNLLIDAVAAKPRREERRPPPPA